MTSKDRKIFITGASGFIGSTCINTIASRPDYTLYCPTSNQISVADKKSLTDYIEKYKPDTVINFAAHRNANTAELQRDNKNGSAWMTNVVGSENITEICQRYGMYLLHISTDMVFAGKKEKKGPYSEEDIAENNPDNLSWYGWTKKLAEDAVTSIKNQAIVRVGNVSKPIYDRTLDYIGKILWQFDTGNSYPLFSDQNITITYIPELVRTLIKLTDDRSSGIYHVSSDDVVTPYELAHYIMSKVRPGRYGIQEASIADYLDRNPRRYPEYGGLKSKSTQMRLGQPYRPWREVVNEFIKKAT